MTHARLRPADRLFTGFARYVERPTLALVAPQVVLRAIFAVTGPLGAARPRDVRIRPDGIGGLWFQPAGVAEDGPVILYFHGGGFTIGSPYTHAALVAHLARSAGMRAYAPRYRLAPQHPFPAAREDALEAARRLLAQGTRIGAICGDSAGGCLTLLTAQHLRDTGHPLPDALALLSPLADLSGDIAARFAAARDEKLIPPVWAHRIRRAFLRDHAADDAAVSPLQGNLAGLPHTLIHVAQGEALEQDAHRLHAALDRADLDIWPDLQHAWHLHAGRMPSATAALAQIGQFLRDTVRR